MTKAAQCLCILLLGFGGELATNVSTQKYASCRVRLRLILPSLSERSQTREGEVKEDGENVICNSYTHSTFAAIHSIQPIVTTGLILIIFRDMHTNTFQHCPVHSEHHGLLKQQIADRITKQLPHNLLGFL
jgi:hypothetical protein